MNKQCTRCKEIKALTCFSKAGRGNALRSNCKTCDANQYKKWKSKNRKKYLDSTTNSGLKLRYGIGLEEYKKLLAGQGDCCKICKSTAPGRKDVNRFAVDHCHTTGKVRGLLCSKCNTAIGLLNENPLLFDEAKKYLQEHFNTNLKQIKAG